MPRRHHRKEPTDWAEPYTGIPTIADLLGSEPWREQAACRDVTERESDYAFFNETRFSLQLTDGLKSAGALVGMLLCERCPVRRDCLEYALPRRHHTTDPDMATARQHQHIQRTWGTWGGTTEAERWPLRDHPTSEAADLLEATFPRRLELRIDAYLANRAVLRPDPATGELRTRRLSKRDRLVDEMLAKRQRKTRHRIGSGKPGPGRGHLGPAGLYAREHGVSVSTARRRLRAA